MQDFSKHFRRDANGTWECMSTCKFDGPTGLVEITAGSKFKRGTIFMGFHLAQWLDEHEENHGSNT